MRGFVPAIPSQRPCPDRQDCHLGAKWEARKKITMTVMTLDPPRQTANPAPARLANSVRRTSSIDVAWPGDAMGDKILHGRSRDFVTPKAGGAAGGAGAVRAAASLEAALDAERTITAISADPAPPQLQRLVGERGGGHLRMLMREIMPDLIADADPLYLLLDDISGVSLIASWAWSLWNPDWRSATTGSEDEMTKMLEERIDVCWGFQRGNSTFDSARRSEVGTADGGELRNPADPAGWHEFPVVNGVSMRRARRIDVWRDEATGVIRIDSAFQDSAPRPDGTRAALHEYRLAASADPVTLELLTLEPEARVLPFGECPGAIGNAVALVGSSLPEIRQSVLNDLRGPRGCTHLNDALRALADVPKLLDYLDQ